MLLHCVLLTVLIWCCDYVQNEARIRIYKKQLSNNFNLMASGKEYLSGYVKCIVVTPYLVYYQ